MIIQYFVLFVMVLIAPYNIFDYQVNEFDCSQMSYICYEHLEKYGFKPVYVLVDKKGNNSHLCIYEQRTGFWVESTTKTVSLFPQEYGNFVVIDNLTEFVDGKKINYTKEFGLK